MDTQTMARNIALWLAVAFVALLVALPARPVAAQAGTCNDVVLDEYGNQFYLPGSSPDGTAICTTDNMRAVSGPAFACGGAIWLEPVFLDSYNEAFIVSPPSYATDDLMRLHFIVQAWIKDGRNFWGEDIHYFKHGWGFRIQTFNASGFPIEDRIFRTGIGSWQVRQVDGLGEVIVDTVNVLALQAAPNGYVRVSVAEYPRNVGFLTNLNIAYSNISFAPAHWTAPPPCPYPGQAPPTPTPTITPTPTATEECAGQLGGCPTPGPSPTPSHTPTLSPTSTNTPGPSPTPSHTPASTATPWPTSAGATVVPTRTPTRYASQPITPQPTYTPPPIPTMNQPNIGNPSPPNLPPINVPPPIFPTWETEPLELPELPPVEWPSVSLPTTTLSSTNFFSSTFTMSNTAMISRTQSITMALTPTSGIGVSATLWITNANTMATGWISSTADTVAWITGDSITGTRPISAAVSMGQTIALPVAAVRGMQLYMPNLWPFIFALLMMMLWISITMLAKFALALFGVIYRIVDILIRWFIPGFG